VYHIAQNFGGKKHWRIWQMNFYLPMFFLPIILTRGVPIGKLTNILITDISAIKSTDSDTDIDITTAMDSSLL